MPLPKHKPVIDVEYEKGKCFICGEDTKGAYAHYACCLAYSDNQDLRLKEALKEDESTPDKSK
jgi:hypothetical protein